MKKLTDRLIKLFIANNIIKEEDSEWFRYGVEKRLSKVFVGIPFFVLAIIMTDIGVAIFFYISFFYLRSMINGMHASSEWACLCISLGLEFLFLGPVKLLMNYHNMDIFMLITLILVFLLAPYNHPNMALTDSEFSACKKHSRYRIILLVVIFVFSRILHATDISEGITLGCSMAVFLLCLAYII